MALSGPAQYKRKHVGSLGNLQMIVKDAAVVYDGALLSHDTATGEVKPFDGTQTDRLVGFHFGDSITGASASTPRPRATVCPGEFVLVNQTCGGLSNDATDYGEAVYATDDGTFTITDPGSGVAIGKVIADDKRDSGKANIYIDNLFGRAA